MTPMTPMTPRTANTLCTHAAILLLAGSALSAATGCKAFRKDKGLSPEDQQTQAEWLENQPITHTDSDQEGQPGTVYEQADTPVTTVIDERPSRQRNAANNAVVPSRRGKPPYDLDAASQDNSSSFEPQTREEQSLANAVRFHSSGDLQAALAELERAIAFNPHFTRAFLEAGDIYMEMAQYDLAERQYAAAVKSEPRNFMAQYRHATVLHQLGELDKSMRAYLRALSIRPADFNANLGVSIVQLELGKAEQALPYAQRAVKNDSSSGRARLHLGNIYAAIDQHADAVVEYQQAAELIDAPTPKLLLNMSESLNQLGRHAEMVGALEQLVRLEPSAIAYERLGSGLFRLKRYDDSLASFNTSTGYDDKHYPALNGVAVCELNNYLWSGKSDRGSRERAVDAMRSSLRIDRQQPKIVELLRRYSNPSREERTGN